jgi:hypothetical protein
VHALPLVFFAVQVVPLQKLPDAQSPSPLQVVGQVALEPLHT